MNPNGSNNQQQFQQQQQPQQQQLQATTQGLLSASVQTKLFDSYSSAPNTYDEVRTADGMLRPQSAKFEEAVGPIDPELFQRRQMQIRRFVHQNGIVFSSYGDPSDRKNHLQLDPIPQIIDAGTWEQITTGLKQRALVYNLLLEDIFGPQKLLSTGVVPPSVVYDHPYFDPAFEDIRPAGGKHLHFYAAELVRCREGLWRVIADRSDAPGGGGFALENRLAISRTFPTEFRAMNAQRLACYFIAVKEMLTTLCPNRLASPQKVILSAGTGSASYFEDAYLSQYLNIPLVECSDLTVRQNRVMHKTLGGLIPIDIIFRRQHCIGLDPLEQGTTGPGVAGILQVARTGNVAISNPPGSGIVESPVFRALLPQISQALLGTDLSLPGIDCWWGGDTNSLHTIRNRIDELDLIPAYRIRTAYDGTKSGSSDGGVMSRDEKLAALNTAPHLWCASERALRSSTSVWKDGSLKTGYLSMRTFAVANKGFITGAVGDLEDGYTVMNGGLSRVTDTPDEPIQRPFEGGGVKDCWIISDEPVDQVSLLDANRVSTENYQDHDHLSSRTADNFCWLGRYLERCDATARLVRSILKRLTGEARPVDVRELPPLVRALAAEGGVDAGYAVPELRRHLPDLEKTIADCFINRYEPNSLRSLVDQFYFVGTEVRERLSSDAWRIIQQLREGFHIDRFTNCDLAEHTEITNELLVDLAALSGFVSESMTRNYGFRFMNIGRRTERALQIIRLVKNCFVYKNHVNDDVLVATLEVADSLMTFRSRHQSNLNLENVLSLMLIEEQNPRSLAYQLVALDQSVHALPMLSKSISLPAHHRLSMEALHTVRMLEASKLCETDKVGRHTGIESICRTMETILPKLSNSISNQYFVHSGPMNQMNQIG